ncbi:MAG: hypothetical protein K2X87_21515 [Gemmataceae bacterium]|nr:hypothetical protein [Gemmataceae bacterium]
MMEDTGDRNVHPLVSGGCVMRLVAAIIAAVMSVTTGGPLRCPCHLVARLRTEPAAVPVPQSAVERPADRCCGCKTNREPRPEPTDPRPAPHPPCPHGPGIDLVPPLATGERVVGGHGSGDQAVTAPGDGHDCPSAWGLDPPLPVPVAVAASPHDQLRYCHAFRC